MAITPGSKLPVATVLKMGDKGPEAVDITQLTAGKKVAIFAVPGAFTGTCTTAHVPSFIRTKAGFDAKGVEAIYCISVNDPFVLKAWGESTGATAAGITMLADPAGEFTKAIGMNFDVPAAGLLNRSNRYAMLVEDGVVKVLQQEEQNGQCSVSGGEALLDAI